jgi:hypothetical protein
VEEKAGASGGGVTQLDGEEVTVKRDGGALARRR